MDKVPRLSKKALVMLPINILAEVNSSCLVKTMQLQVPLWLGFLYTHNNYYVHTFDAFFRLFDLCLSCV